MASIFGFDNLVVIGEGAMPARCASILAKGGVNITALIESGEGRFSSLESVARKYSIPYRRMDGGRLTRWLLKLAGATLIFSVNNNYLFPEMVIDRIGVRIVNFHNSMLPDYPGRNVPTWVVFNGERSHGVTWHLVDSGTDTGNILAQATFEVADGAIARDVMAMAIKLGLELFEESWRLFAEPEFMGTRQAGHSRPIKSGEIPNKGRLDTGWSLARAERFLRAMDYGAFPVVGPARFSTGNGDYRIKDYKVNRARREVMGGADRQYLRSQAHEQWEATLEYPDGTIELTLEKEKEQARGKDS